MKANWTPVLWRILIKKKKKTHNIVKKIKDEITSYQGEGMEEEYELPNKREQLNVHQEVIWRM